MTDISQFTSKFRLGPSAPAGSSSSNNNSSTNVGTNGNHSSNGNGATEGKVAKRNRQPLSCQPCRVRKLRCDRGRPCDSCVKRSDEQGCIYGKVSSSAGMVSVSVAGGGGANGTNGGVNSSGSSARHRNGSGVGGSNVRAQDRLKQLEEMVRQMIDEKAENNAASDDAQASTGINQQSQRQALKDRGANYSSSALQTPQILPNGQLNPNQSENQDDSQGEVNSEEPLTRARHGTNYTGSTHWTAILDHIHDLRTDLAEADGSCSADRELYSTSSSGSTPSDSQFYGTSAAIFAAPQPLPLESLLDMYLPSRQQADRYLSTYFRAKYLVLPFLHTQQFSRQYEQFWRDPLGTSPTWISILFSIMCIADMIRHATSGPSNPNGGSLSQGASLEAHSANSNSSAAVRQPPSPFDPYSASPNRDSLLSASSQCLILGNFARPQPHLIEALGLNAQCKYVLTLDPSREAAAIFSFLVRQAYNMSYHRDCSNFAVGQYTPFETEMRRRTWALLKMFDMMVSFQFGVPPNISEGSWDTKPPRNLLDADFDEDSKEMPRDRDDAEPSPMLYFVIKAKLVEIYGKVVRYTLSFPKPGETIQMHEERELVMKLDGETRKAAEEMPLVMKLKPMRQSYSDPSYLVMLRQNLYFTTHKCLCVLHRKFMMKNGTKPSHEGTYSRKVVLDSATKLVTSFIDTHFEFQTEGQLYDARWMQSSFKINDFCLALVLMLFVFWTERSKAIANGTKGESEVKLEQKWLQSDNDARSTYELLVQAKDVCAEYGKRGDEARRVAEIIDLAMSRVGNVQGAAVGGGDTSKMQSGIKRAFESTLNHPPMDQDSQKSNITSESISLTPLSISGRQASHRAENADQAFSFREEIQSHEHAAGMWIQDSGIRDPNLLASSASGSRSQAGNTSNPYNLMMSSSQREDTNTKSPNDPWPLHFPVMTPGNNEQHQQQQQQGASSFFPDLFDPNAETSIDWNSVDRLLGFNSDMPTSLDLGGDMSWFQNNHSNGNGNINDYGTSAEVMMSTMMDVDSTSTTSLANHHHDVHNGTAEGHENGLDSDVSSRVVSMDKGLLGSWGGMSMN